MEALVTLLVVVLAGLVLPMVFALMLIPYVLELKARYDPEPVERPDGVDIPMKIALAVGSLAMLGGFFFALAVVWEQEVWLMAGWPLWIGALRLLKRWDPESE